MQRIHILVGVKKTFVSSYAVRLNPPSSLAGDGDRFERVKKDQEIVIHGNIIIER